MAGSGSTIGSQKSGLALRVGGSQLNSRNNPTTIEAVTGIISAWKIRRYRHSEIRARQNTYDTLPDSFPSPYIAKAQNSSDTADGPASLSSLLFSLSIRSC